MNIQSLTTAYWCVIVAGVLPYLTTFVAKAGSYGPRDNQAPREWSTRQSGWRSRLMAAAANGFETLPMFMAAVIIAHQLGYSQSTLDLYAMAYVALRVVYVAIYGAGAATVRSLVWGLAMLANAAIFFIGK
ncbi:MAPEG family protein [Variovorax dokdonensis]|uniref:MAPEG family protein n=1 Tax=Variovorax dokdonensis TaxID=344883 RepID=A0ABT7NCR4_9BURK|nr:MAPEG family protein [Variovorax dokdonensis]MDM0045670.1 MAPEG family protein [Variovorax dokdonensis]